MRQLSYLYHIAVDRQAVLDISTPQCYNFCMDKIHNKSRKRFAAAALAAAAALLAGCGGSVSKQDGSGGNSSAADSGAESGSIVSASSAADEESRVIALAIADGKLRERWDGELTVFEECAKNQNCRLRVIDAEGDAARQAEKCAALLNSETVDEMILQPLDQEQASGIVSSAHDVGVPVIAYERMIRNAEVDYFVCAGTESGDEKEPERNLAKAAGALAGMAARGDYPMTRDMTADGSWTEVAVGRETVPTFVVSDPAGEDQPE